MRVMRDLWSMVPQSSVIRQVSAVYGLYVFELPNDCCIYTDASVCNSLLYCNAKFTTTTLLYTELVYSLGAIHTVSMAYVRNSDFFLASNVVSTAFTFTIRMSVCPSVCLSHSSSTPKRFKMWKYFHTIRWSNVSSFLRPNQS